MKKERVKHFQELLLKKKSELANNVSDEEREGREAVSVEAKDFADMATEAYGQEMSFSLSDAGRRTLRDVEDALVRVRDGGYGVCERCGKEIAESRLEAVPHARMCVSCQEASEIKGTR